MMGLLTRCAVVGYGGTRTVQISNEIILPCVHYLPVQDVLTVQVEQRVYCSFMISPRASMPTSRHYGYGGADECSRQSFMNLAKWLTDCRALASPHLVLVLVGNKLDKEDDREVEYAEGSRWAQENGTSRLYPHIIHPL